MIVIVHESIIISLQVVNGRQNNMVMSEENIVDAS